MLVQLVRNQVSSIEMFTSDTYVKQNSDDHLDLNVNYKIVYLYGLYYSLQITIDLQIEYIRL